MANYFNPYQQYYPQTQQNYQQQTQMQSGGFVSIPNEDMVASYPVAPGNCVTFKVEGKPIVLEKSMGFSQLEAPKIEKYRLVKEGDPEEDNSFSKDVDSIRSDIKKIWGEINAIKNRKPRSDKNGDN